jgi:hypothetical protein
MGGACSTYGGQDEAYTVLVGKLKGNSPLGRPRHRWQHNSKINLIGIEWRAMDWIDLAQDRGQWKALVKTLINLGVK